MQSLGMRQAAVCKPESLVETNTVDHQRVAFPLADGIAIVGGNNVVGLMRPAIEIDQTPVAIAAARHHEYAFALGLFDNLNPVGSLELARPTGRKATGH